MQLINHMRLEFDARPENESFAHCSQRLYRAL